MTAQRSLRYLTLGCFLVAIISIGQGGYLLAKAHLAQYLLEHAWQQQKLNSDSSVKNYHKPWPWADIYPVAKISFERLNKSYLVLNNDSGQALAFGPGLYQSQMQSSDQNTIQSFLPQVSIISAHNDSHFSILEMLVVGDKVSVTLASGNVKSFTVDIISILDTRTEQLFLQNYMPAHMQKKSNDDGLNELILVTCYPFRGLDDQTPFRYLVYLS